MFVSNTLNETRAWAVLNPVESTHIGVQYAFLALNRLHSFPWTSISRNATPHNEPCTLLFMWADHCDQIRGHKTTCLSPCLEHVSRSTNRNLTNSRRPSRLGLTTDRIEMSLSGQSNSASLAGGRDLFSTQIRITSIFPRKWTIKTLKSTFTTEYTLLVLVSAQTTLILAENMSGESILITLATTPGGPTSFPAVLKKVMDLPPPNILGDDDGTLSYRINAVISSNNLGLMVSDNDLLLVVSVSVRGQDNPLCSCLFWPGTIWNRISDFSNATWRHLQAFVCHCNDPVLFKPLGRFYYRRCKVWFCALSLEIIE